MDGCAQMCKCFLILFNILFALVGFCLVALGIWLRFGAETRGFFDMDLNTPEFNIGVTVLVVTGVLMLLVAVIGDCGACNNSKSALGVFSGLLSILIIMEITAGVMAFMRSARVSDELVYFYDTIYVQYVNSRSPGQAVTLKLFHNAFDCCGVSETIEVFVRDTCPKGSFLKQISYSSCPVMIREVFNANAPLVLGGFLGIAGIMTLALVCSCVLQRRVSVSHKSPPPYVLLGSPLSAVIKEYNETGVERSRNRRRRNVAGGPRRELGDPKIIFKMKAILRLIRKQETMNKRVAKLIKQVIELQGFSKELQRLMNDLEKMDFQTPVLKKSMSKSV